MVLPVGMASPSNWNMPSHCAFVGGVPIQLVNQTLADVLKLRPLDAHAKAALQLLDPQHPLPRTSGESRCKVPTGMHQPAPQDRMRTPTKPTAFKSVPSHREEQSTVAISRAGQRTRPDRKDGFQPKGAAITGEKR